MQHHIHTKFHNQDLTGSGYITRAPFCYPVLKKFLIFFQKQLFPHFGMTADQSVKKIFLIPKDEC